MKAQSLTAKEFLRVLPVSLLIAASAWTLVIIFLLVLPTFSSVPVHREDREVVEKLHALATWIVVISTFCGAALGISVPIAIRWGRKRWRDEHESKRVA